MRIHGFVVIVGLLALSACASLSRHPRTSHLPQGLYGSVAVADGGAVYLYGGAGLQGYSNALYRIDPVSGDVVLLNQVGTPRRFFSATVFAHRLFVFGGDGRIGARRVQLGFGERISLGSPAQNEGGISMPVERRGSGAAVLDRRIYLVGGWSDFHSARRTRRVDIYDPGSDTWTSGPKLVLAREGAVVVVGQRIFALGGYDGTRAMRAVQVLDGGAGQWRRLEDLPVAVSATAMVVADADIFMFGDYDELGRVLRYDTEKQLLYRVDVSFTPRRHAAAARVGSRIVVAGGNVRGSGSWLDTVEIFSVKQLRNHSTPIGS